MTHQDQLPLQGLLVLDFSQFLAGPSAALRLADMGATVIKIERPVQGDLCRQLYISDLQIDGDSTLFHTINRNKRSYAADLKHPADLVKVQQLIAQADVMIENFRPGVMQRIGLSYEAVQPLNPGMGPPDRGLIYRVKICWHKVEAVWFGSAVMQTKVPCPLVWPWPTS
jgi:CoA:oxalate CoA-transferase